MERVTGTIKPRQEEKELQFEQVERQEEKEVVVEPPKPKVRPAHFKMVKNSEGSLAVTLEAHDFSTPPRTIIFKWDKYEQNIPIKWAVGTFVSDGALRQMEKGYFTFENLEVLIEMAEEMGHLVPDTIKEPKVTLKEITKALRNADMKAIDQITYYMTNKIRSDIVRVAKKLYSNLNMSVIQHLENKLNVSLAPINLDD